MISPVKRRKHARNTQYQSLDRVIAQDEVHDHSVSYAVDRSNGLKKLRYSLCFIFIVVCCRAIFHANNFNSGLHQKQHDEILPISSVDKNSQLIGKYTLDGEHSYWAEENKSPKDMSGMIYFPSVDLITTFEEDATNKPL
jgi:hypothetical protein